VSDRRSEAGGVILSNKECVFGEDLLIDADVRLSKLLLELVGVRRMGVSASKRIGVRHELQKVLHGAHDSRRIDAVGHTVEGEGSLRKGVKELLLRSIFIAEVSVPLRVAGNDPVLHLLRVVEGLLHIDEEECLVANDRASYNKAKPFAPPDRPRSGRTRRPATPRRRHGCSACPLGHAVFAGVHPVEIALEPALDSRAILGAHPGKQMSGGPRDLHKVQRVDDADGATGVQVLDRLGVLQTGIHARRWVPTSEEDREAVREAMEKVLASSQFCNNRHYPGLLRYLVDNALEGKSDHLKERIVGVEVFGRTSDYDTNSDTIGAVYRERGSQAACALLSRPGRRAYSDHLIGKVLSAQVPADRGDTGNACGSR